MGLWILESRSVEHVPGTVEFQKHHKPMINDSQGQRDTSMIPKDLKLRLQTLLD